MIERFTFGLRSVLLCGALALASCGEGQTPDASLADAAATQAAAAAVQAELAATAPDGPLPDTVIPLAYDLAMTVDPRQAGYTGEVRIRVRLTERAEGIWLHGKGLNVEAASMTMGGEVVPALYNDYLPSGVARVSFRDPMGPGEGELMMRYSAPFDTQLAGLFKVQEGEDQYALVKSESIQARRAFPGFDEPRFKTPFSIAVRVAGGDVALANTPIQSRTDLGDGFEEIVFEPTPPLPTYLLSLAVGPFEEVAHPDLPPTEIRDRPVPVSGWARRGKGADMAHIMSLTQVIVETFEERFGEPYPYAKLDIIAAPDWPSGATELAAAPTYREDVILVGSEPAPGAARRVLSIHAHELAHMWFGDYVTMPWWDDLWLKEAFAVWAEPIAGQAADPSGGWEVNSVLEALDGFASDELMSARAVREPIAGNDDIRNAYDSITYAKGPAVLAMAEAFVGPDAWRAGLQAYFNAFPHGVADSDDFYALMGEAAGDPSVAVMLKSFIERSGLPRVDAELSCEPGVSPTVTLAQSRYAPLGSRIDPDETWTTPVCVRTGGAGQAGERACVLLSEARGEIALTSPSCPDWVMPNADATGYYRFALDRAGWLALETAFDDLTPREALMAVDSAIAAYEAGEADTDSLLRLFRRAAAHPNRHVAVQPLDALNRFARILADEDDQARALLAVEVQGLYGARLRTLASAPSTPETTLLLRQLEGALAELGQDSSVRADLADRARRFIGVDGPRDPSALTADQYTVATRVAVEDLGPGFVDALLASRASVDDPAFDRAALSALAAADDPEAAERVRAFALSPEAPARDAYSILIGQTRNRETRAAAWAWLESEFDAIAAKVPDQWRRNLPLAGGAFCARSDAEALDALFAEKGGLAPGHARALDQTREAIALCQALREAKAAEFKVALMPPAP